MSYHQTVQEGNILYFRDPIRSQINILEMIGSSMKYFQSIQARYTVECKDQLSQGLQRSQSLYNFDLNRGKRRDKDD